MANLKMVPKGASVLRKKATPIKKNTPEIEKLVRDMFDLMYEIDGIGLAASQVGVSKRVIVIDVGEYDQLSPSPIALVNPKIIDRSDEEVIAEEACLSVPESSGPVKRAKRVTVKAMTLDGEKITIEGVDLMARVLQHEIDHLEGRLFIDRINEEDTKLFKKQQTRSIFGNSR